MVKLTLSISVCKNICGSLQNSYNPNGSQWFLLEKWWYNTTHITSIHMTPFEAVYGQNPPHYYLLNWAHRSVDKHTTHKIDHTIYSLIEEWNNAKMAATVNAFINKKKVIR